MRDKKNSPPPSGQKPSLALPDSTGSKRWALNGNIPIKCKVHFAYLGQLFSLLFGKEVRGQFSTKLARDMATQDVTQLEYEKSLVRIAHS